MQTNNNLIPVFDGRVLVNETALHNKNVMNVLKSSSLNDFQFKGTWIGDRVSISDFLSSTK